MHVLITIPLLIFCLIGLSYSVLELAIAYKEDIYAIEERQKQKDNQFQYKRNG